METNQLLVKMVLDRWYTMIKDFETTLHELTDEQLEKEISPGRNRGIYLLGHMVAVHDDMLPILGFGDKLYPELNAPFIDSPDKAVATLPPASELRAHWTELNNFLTQKINSLQPGEWFQKHNAVSAEDFSKEPHRNKLNVMLNRTTHLAYHHGQFILIR